MLSEFKAITPPQLADDRPDRPVILVVSHRDRQCGVHDYALNIVRALGASTKYVFRYSECASAEELDQAITLQRPSAVIYNWHISTMPWLNAKVTRRYRVPQFGILHEVTQAVADGATADVVDYHLCPDPTLIERNPRVFRTPRLVPSYSPTPAEPGVVTIGSFGFGIHDKGFDRLVSHVQYEFDEARIMLHMPFNDVIDHDGSNHALATAARCRAMLKKPGIQLFISHNYLGRTQLLDFIASNTVNAFFYDTQSDHGISSVIDHALAVRRPIAITRSGMFRHILAASPSITIETSSLRQIIANGTEPLDQFYEQWSESAFVRAYESILDSVLERADTVHAALSTPHKPPKSFNRILDNGMQGTYAPVVAALFESVSDIMQHKTPGERVQQAFTLDTVTDFALTVPAPRLLCVGAHGDATAATLGGMGVPLQGVDPVINMDLGTFCSLPSTVKGSYDVVFATSVISEVVDDERFVRQIAELLKVGGVAVLTCDFDDGNQRGDSTSKPGYRMYTGYDLRERLLDAMPDCELVDKPLWEYRRLDHSGPSPDQGALTPEYAFATFVVRKCGVGSTR